MLPGGCVRRQQNENQISVCVRQVFVVSADGTVSQNDLFFSLFVVISVLRDVLRAEHRDAQAGRCHLAPHPSPEWVFHRLAVGLLC